MENQYVDPMASTGVAAMAPLGTQPQAAAAAQVTAPQVPGVSGAWQATNNGTVFNSSTGQIQQPGFFQQGGGATLALGAIGTLGSLWNSFQQSKLAKQSLGLQTRSFEQNMHNATQSYNTALEGRIRSQYRTEGKSQKEADSYIERNKL